MNEYIPPVVGAGVSGVNGPIVPVGTSGGYLIYNADGTIMCIMPDGSIIYYDSEGHKISQYP